MSNSASFVVFAHQRAARTAFQRFSDIVGSNTSTAVTLTAHTVPQAVFIEKTAPSFTVHVATYSYDGVIHTDSYWSDV